MSLETAICRIASSLVLVVHHKEQRNRLDRTSVYHERVLALHYSIRQSLRFSVLNEAFLVWSLLASAAEFGARPLIADIEPADGSSSAEILP